MSVCLPLPRSRMMDEFSISVAIRDGSQVVTVTGDLDTDTAPSLDDVLDRLLAGMRVLVDLSRVRFLTSAGIVALLSERAFGRPALFAPDGSRAARMLEIVQAQLLVPIFRDLDAALKGLGAAA